MALHMRNVGSCSSLSSIVQSAGENHACSHVRAHVHANVAFAFLHQFPEGAGACLSGKGPVRSWEDTSDQEHCIVGSNKALKSIWENFYLLVCFVWLYFKESV